MEVGLRRNPERLNSILNTGSNPTEWALQILFVQHPDIVWIHYNWVFFLVSFWPNGIEIQIYLTDTFGWSAGPRVAVTVPILIFEMAVSFGRYVSIVTRITTSRDADVIANRRTSDPAVIWRRRRPAQSHRFMTLIFFWPNSENGQQQSDDVVVIKKILFPCFYLQQSMTRA